MALMRREPLRELENIQHQMNRVLDYMLSSSGDRMINSAMTFAPRVEIQETDDSIRLKMEVPGVEPNNLDIRVSMDTVAIRGERKSEVQRDDKGMHRSEFRYGQFQRAIRLPARVQNDQVQAEFQHGVLCLTLPKLDEEKHRVVKVNLTGQNHSNGQSNGQSNGPMSEPKIDNRPTQNHIPKGTSAQTATSPTTMPPASIASSTSPQDSAQERMIYNREPIASSGNQS